MMVLLNWRLIFFRVGFPAAGAAAFLALAVALIFAMPVRAAEEEEAPEFDANAPWREQLEDLHKDFFDTRQYREMLVDAFKLRERGDGRPSAGRIVEDLIRRGRAVPVQLLGKYASSALEFFGQHARIAGRLKTVDADFDLDEDVTFSNSEIEISAAGAFNESRESQTGWIGEANLADSGGDSRSVGLYHRRVIGFGARGGVEVDYSYEERYGGRVEEGVRYVGHLSPQAAGIWRGARLEVEYNEREHFGPGDPELLFRLAYEHVLGDENQEADEFYVSRDFDVGSSYYRGYRRSYGGGIRRARVAPLRIAQPAEGDFAGRGVGAVVRNEVVFLNDTPLRERLTAESLQAVRRVGLNDNVDIVFANVDPAFQSLIARESALVINPEDGLETGMFRVAEEVKVEGRDIIVATRPARMSDLLSEGVIQFGGRLRPGKKRSDAESKKHKRLRQLRALLGADDQDDEKVECPNGEWKESFAAGAYAGCVAAIIRVPSVQFGPESGEVLISAGWTVRLKLISNGALTVNRLARDIPLRRQIFYAEAGTGRRRLNIPVGFAADLAVRGGATLNAGTTGGAEMWSVGRTGASYGRKSGSLREVEIGARALKVSAPTLASMSGNGRVDLVLSWAPLPSAEWESAGPRELAALAADGRGVYLKPSLGMELQGDPGRILAEDCPWVNVAAAAEIAVGGMSARKNAREVVDATAEQPFPECTKEEDVDRTLTCPKELCPD